MAEPATPVAATRYRYRAVDRVTGAERLGELEGSTATEVRAQLRRLGLDSLEVQPLRPIATPSGNSGWRRWCAQVWERRVRRSNALAKADLLDGVATLLDAGVPLEQALASLAEGRSRTGAERAVLRRMRDAIRGGQSPMDACAGNPMWFDPLDIALIAATQRTGDLSSAFRALGQHHQRDGAIGQRITAALLYPLILGIAGIVVWEFLSLKTLPPLIALIEQSRRPPPWLTVAVADAGRAFVVLWPVVAVGCIGGVMAMRRLLDRVPVDALWARWRFTNPWSRIQIQVRCARVSHALARLLRAGTPLTEALDVVAAVAGDVRLAALMRSGAAAVRRGEDLSATVAESPLLDQEFAQILRLGEQSGELAALLERIAERYQRSAERAVDRFAAIAGPAAIVVLACLIGVVVMAAVLPLVQLGDLV